jgi:dolichol-phosphate mannosyltransferase
MVSVYFIGGLVIANLGVIGFYLGRTYDEVKRRPLYLVEATTWMPEWTGRDAVSRPPGG